MTMWAFGSDFFNKWNRSVLFRSSRSRVYKVNEKCCAWKDPIPEKHQNLGVYLLYYGLEYDGMFVGPG